MIPTVVRLAAPGTNATLALLVLVAGAVAFGPVSPAHRPVGLADGPAIVGGATLPASATAGVVEFLWATEGDQFMMLREPGPVAAGPEGSLWIPDGSHDRFLVLASNGWFLDAWGTPGSDEGEFEFSDGVYGGVGFGGAAFDDAGNLYVADTGNDRVQKFGPDLAFVTAWGEEGSGAGQFRRLTSVAVDRRGRVYAVDTGWGKIEVFDADGAWIATWAGLETPTGLAVEGDGNVLVADTGAGVLRFSPDGELLATLSRYGSGDGEFLTPTALAVDSRGRIFVVDSTSNRVKILAPDGTFLGGWGGYGVGPGAFRSPHGIAIGHEGIVYVNDRLGDRLQAFRLLPPVADAASTEP